MATKKAKPKSCHDTGGAEHPDHSYILARLNKVQGQLGGIERMVQEKRYCVDILVQFRAAMAALRNIEVDVFKTHLQHCVTQAMNTKDPAEAQKKIDELTELLVRRTQL